MILFISGSPRRDRTIHTTLKKISEQINFEYEIVTLAGKKISGCIGCELCAKDNVCKVKDDWQAIAEKMKNAELIVFGAPNYFNNINAIAHSFWERTFSFKHQGVYTLKDKYGIIVTAKRDENSVDTVYPIINQFMKFNKIEVIGQVCGIGCDPCFTCGYGHNCTVGNVYNKFGILEKIEDKHFPMQICQQTNTLEEIKHIADIINSTCKKDSLLVNTF